ncbi:hypothetical protein D0Y65_020641 [Glycine soja]|uniref:Uncharacterized protein n=1 Tax=Glycine soja TaxID=3848 RepID=A0A445JF51_GLYSO|nr:hypothetical protein D0Y65_020641 [Glycine soja]
MASTKSMFMSFAILLLLALFSATVSAQGSPTPAPDAGAAGSVSSSASVIGAAVVFWVATRRTSHIPNTHGNGRGGHRFKFGVGTGLVIPYSYSYLTFDYRGKSEPIPSQPGYYSSKSGQIQMGTHGYGFSCHV